MCGSRLYPGSKRKKIGMSRSSAENAIPLPLGSVALAAKVELAEKIAF